MQQLGENMTAEEFGQHLALEREEPVSMGVFKLVSKLLAAIANGPLQAPAAGRNWAPHDFMPDLWADIADDEQIAGADTQPEQLTVDQIMARARTVGMVH